MQDQKEENMFEETGLMLSIACPSLARNLVTHFQMIKRNDLAVQINNVYIPPQVIGGVLERFSFMAYSIPRINLEQRQVIELRDRETISVEFDNRVVNIDIDEFGFINWFDVSNFPEMYKSITMLLSNKNYTIKQGGDN